MEAGAFLVVLLIVGGMVFGGLARGLRRLRARSQRLCLDPSGVLLVPAARSAGRQRSTRTSLGSNVRPGRGETMRGRPCLVWQHDTLGEVALVVVD